MLCGGGNEKNLLPCFKGDNVVRRKREFSFIIICEALNDDGEEKISRHVNICFKDGRME